MQWIKYIFYASALLAMASCSKSQRAEELGHEQQAVSILAENSNPYNSHLDTVIDDGCIPLRTNWHGSMQGTFKDINDVHMAAAEAIGIKPIESESDIWNIRRNIVLIESCEEYFLEKLTHSYPYLVPEAAQLLKDIGRTFNDSLAARGGGAYRIRVTSVLRTPTTVKNLHSVNRNASKASVHCYGTTFDISHSKFVCDSITDTNRTYGDLKNLLAEIILDFKRQGRCYVKYEVKQSCFHITARN